MGKIEESITDNYKTALRQGDTLQAKKSIELARILRSFIDNESFKDFDISPISASITIGSVFNPVPYKYDSDNGIIVISNSAINLTGSENQLLSLFCQNETYQEHIKIINKDEIKHYIWPNQKVTDNAVRILIKRFRQKIESNPLNPQIVINYNKKGYVFVAKMYS